MHASHYAFPNHTITPISDLEMKNKIHLDGRENAFKRFRKLIITLIVWQSIVITIFQRLTRDG